MRRFALRITIIASVLAGLVFVPAGRWDLPVRWAYLGIITGATTLGRWLLDPELIEERIRPGPGGIDRKLGFAALPCFAVHMIVAGLDVGRYHWSDGLPCWLRLTALVVLGLSLSLSTWAMHTNRFFSPVVRIQSERGHHVVTSGPYAWVRHPGYAAALLALPTSAIALGSWWSLVPLVPVVAMIVRRMWIEDRYLREHLPGYQEYAARVRHWLVPYVL